MTVTRPKGGDSEKVQVPHCPVDKGNPVERTVESQGRHTCFVVPVCLPAFMPCRSPDKWFYRAKAPSGLLHGRS